MTSTALTGACQAVHRYVTSLLWIMHLACTMWHADMLKPELHVCCTHAATHTC
jgi:hypothetical protein